MITLPEVDPAVGAALRRVTIAVKGSGNIVSHPPKFSSDARTLFIIQNNTLLLYDTSTVRLTGRFIDESAAPIANVGVSRDDPDLVLVFTATGDLLEVDIPSLTVVRRTKMQWRNRDFPQASVFTNFIWPDTVSPKCPRPHSCFFLMGHQEGSTSPHPTAFSVRLHVDRKGPVEETSGGHLSYYFEVKDVAGSIHSVACGDNGHFVAVIQHKHLFVKDMTTNKCRWHMAGTRKFTCVAVHPTEWVCATGDDSGRIVIWSNVWGSPVKSIYHWHTLPVSGLSFSASGSQMYSGGGECTFVKWDLNHTENKRTLPRLGLPIRHVSSSPTDEMVAISQADNSVKLISAYNEIIGVIENLTQCYIPENIEMEKEYEWQEALSPTKIFSAGLSIDPNNMTLITNGRPGQLQCYSWREDRHLYSLNITQQNFITGERNNPIPNSEVEHVSFSTNGTWLATSEARKALKERQIDGKICTELRLKFWKFDRERQIFVLNTSIEWPHEKEVNALKFQPGWEGSSADFPCCASAGENGFKIWGLLEDESIHGKKEWWNTEFCGTYKSSTAGPLAYSEDGSLLAAAFERSLTVWDTDKQKLLVALTHSELNDKIRLLEFGTHQSSHLVIACTISHLAIWDICTCSLLWVAPFQTEALAVDRHTNLAAAISTTNRLIFFSPSNAKPLAVHENVSATSVASAIFVPNEKATEDNCLQSTLFFINESQELCALVPESMQSSTIETARVSSSSAAGKAALTPFAQLIAEKIIFETTRKPKEAISANKSAAEGFRIFQDIMDQSPHTMPSLTFYCTRLLEALSIRRNPGDRLSEMEELASQASKNIKWNNSGDSDNDSELSDSEEKVLQFPDIKKEMPPRNKPDLNTILNEDRTWIRNIFE